MTPTAHTREISWQQANQQHLMEAVGSVRAALKRQASGSHGETPADPHPDAAPRAWPAHLDHAPALETLTQSFGLSNFERQVLLLCAGVELASDIADLCAAAQNDPHSRHPTFSLALAALPGAHWSALAPSRPLRHWRLVETSQQDRLTESPLHIDERVLHYLTGVQHLDERLAGYIEPADAVAVKEFPAYRRHAAAVRAAWSANEMHAELPIIQLWGRDPSARRAVALETCRQLGLNLFLMRAGALPTDPREGSALMRLWERESVLSRGVLLLEIDDDHAQESGTQRAAGRWIESNRTPLIVSTRDRLSTPHKAIIAQEIPVLAPEEQRYLLEQALGERSKSLNGGIDAVVAQFQLNPAAISGLRAEMLAILNDRDTAPDAEGLEKALWEACRAQARPRMGELAQPIQAVAGWDDLVLPQPQKSILEEIAIQVRQRARVYGDWGFAARSSRGLGISALFAGPSGTGKTMAAEVLANSLNLDLYRIDLSQVVSKYIGETEKNLRRVFDAAEAGGAILLFDEADALFGKRSEVKDSHDRYANIEVSYLLQRMEEYRGLAILTSNMKGALDQAFLRRIRFVVSFPFPDEGQRRAIWEHIYPPETPTEGLDFDKLARLNVTGGNIRNIALYAAFLAAEAGAPVRMSHLLRAARVEYAKLEKTLTAGEVRDWEVAGDER